MKVLHPTASDEKRMPSGGAYAVAAFIGIVFGAMGGGFAVVIALATLILIAVGVWRAVDVLVDIYDRLDPDPAPATGVSLDTTETVRLK